MSIELDKPTVNPEALRKEWQEKHDPELKNLHGMRKFIEERMGDQSPTIPEEDQALASSGEPEDTKPEPGKFNNFQ